MKLAGVFALCTCIALAQPAPKQNLTVILTNPATPETAKQMTGVVKTVAGVLDVQFDPANATFNLRGYDNELPIAEWLLRKMDKPAGWQPAQAGDVSANEYRAQPGAIPIVPSEAVARVHYLRNSTPRDSIEIATNLRIVGNIAHVARIDQPALIAVRSTEVQADLADWLIDKLDLPPMADVSALQSGINSYSLPPGPDGATESVQVFYLNPSLRPARIREIAAQVRTGTGMKLTFSKTSPPTIVVRGSGAQIAQGRQIIQSNTD